MKPKNNIVTPGIHSLTYSLTLSFTLSFNYSLNRAFVHSLTCLLT